MTLRVLARRRAGLSRCRGEQHRGASAPSRATGAEQGGDNEG